MLLKSTCSSYSLHIHLKAILLTCNALPPSPLTTFARPK
ncbi:hypothetical protein APHCR_1483 [Anaplasma phagocytophilum str. CR1007]|nr:hypothetical protein APHCR_1483 [Anaplasma phagocytophilum str. CR1007]